MATPNIVTGDSNVNLPTNDSDDVLVPVPSDKPVDAPSGSSAAQQGAPAPAVPNPMVPGVTPVDEPPSALSEDVPLNPAEQIAMDIQQETPANMPIRSLTPITSVGLPPWLAGNPNQMPVLPDVSAWRDLMQQNQLQPRQEQTVLDLPYSFPQPRVPLLDSGTGRDIMDTFQRMREQNALRALQPRLGGFMQGRYNTTPPSNQLNSNIAVPGSNRSVLRNEPRYDENRTGQNRLRDFFFGAPTTTLGDTARENQNLFGAALGAARDLWGIITGDVTEDQRQAVQDLTREFFLGNPVTGDTGAGDREIRNITDTFNRLWRAVPSAQPHIMQGLQNALPEEDTSSVSGYRFDPVQGYFGEFGRGWTGALNTALATPENLVYAGVYSAIDLARGLAGEAGDNVPFLRNVPRDDERRGLTYRFGQAFSGVDLDIANIRDGSGNRYLAVVDPEAPLNTQIQQWGWALAASTVLGNPIDDLYSAGFRNARRFGTALQRTGDVRQAWEMNRRAGRIASLRTARQSIPDFTPVPPREPDGRVIITPEPPDPHRLLPAWSPSTGELPEVSPSAGAVVSLEEYTNPLLDPGQALRNITPGEVMRSIELNPTSTPPLPFFAPRSNDELLQLGHELGVVDESVDFLNNSDVARLQQLYGDTFSRFGHPLPPVPETNVQNIDVAIPPDYFAQGVDAPDFTFYQGQRVSGALFPDLQGRPGVYEVGFDIDFAQTRDVRPGNIPMHELRDLRNSFNQMLEENPALGNYALTANAQSSSPDEYLMKIRHYLRYDEFRLFRQEMNIEGDDFTVHYREVPYSEVVEEVDRRRELMESTGTEWLAPNGTYQLLGMNVRQVLAEGDTMEELPNSIRPALEQVQEGSSTITRTIAETGEISSDLERTLRDDILPFSRPAHDRRVVETWRNEEAPANLRGDTAIARDYLINEDDFDGAARGLQELEAQIDELRGYVIQNGARLTPGGDLSLYRRGNMADELTTQGYYGNVVPGSQVQELLEPVPYQSATFDEYLEGMALAEQDALRTGVPNTPDLTRRAVEDFRSGRRQSVDLDQTEQVRVRVQPDEVGDMDIPAQIQRLGIDPNDPDALSKAFIGATSKNADLSRFRFYDSTEEIARIRGRSDDSSRTLTGMYDEYRRGLQAEQPLYHGSQQVSIDRVNFHHGTAHEYGTGLYVSTDPNYALLAARASRTSNNPVPGTTRLAPEGSGFVYQVNARTDNLLNGDDISALDVRHMFNDVFTSVFGDRAGSAWAAMLSERRLRNKELWLTAREVYADTFGAPVPEIKFREFSNRVNAELKKRGIDGIRDNRGVINLFADDSGRVAMDVNPTPIPGDAGRVGATYARQAMDAQALKEFPDSPTIKAWEMQSRVQLGNAMMEDLLASYQQGVRQTNELLTDMLESERRLRDDAIAVQERTLEDLIATAPEAALNTEDFKQFRDVPPESPCL